MVEVLREVEFFSSCGESYRMYALIEIAFLQKDRNVTYDVSTLDFIDK